MLNKFERRMEYFTGYMIALQDVVRDVRENEFLEIAETFDKLTRLAVADISRETEKEVKVPDA